MGGDNCVSLTTQFAAWAVSVRPQCYPPPFLPVFTCIHQAPPRLCSWAGSERVDMAGSKKGDTHTVSSLQLLSATLPWLCTAKLRRQVENLAYAGFENPRNIEPPSNWCQPSGGFRHRLSLRLSSPSSWNLYDSAEKRHFAVSYTCYFCP